jgi:hypothetical protein
MLVAFELFDHPGPDFFSELHDVGWVCANVEIHKVLLSVASKFLVEGE